MREEGSEKLEVERENCCVCVCLCVLAEGFPSISLSLAAEVRHLDDENLNAV